MIDWTWQFKPYEVRGLRQPTVICEYCRELFPAYVIGKLARPGYFWYQEMEAEDERGSGYRVGEYGACYR